MKMKIVAFLQNQWFREPKRVEEMLARFTDAAEQRKRRQMFARRALFMGCLTGRRLLECLGHDLCDTIHWENASTIIGDEASSSPPADLEHIKLVLEEQRADAVVAFGKTATLALVDLVPEEDLILAPHPAARGNEVKTRLREVRSDLESRREAFLLAHPVDEFP